MGDLDEEEVARHGHWWDVLRAVWRDEWQNREYFDEGREDRDERVKAWC